MFLFFGSRFADDKLLLVPFVSGFSTDLVLGVINQAVTTIKGTMGIRQRASEYRVVPD
jgi:hypothetical protein